MAIISYPSTTNFGSITAVSVGAARQALEQLKRVQDAANAIAFSATSPPNWALLETNTDFMIGAGKGQVWFDAVTSLVNALATSSPMAAFSNLDKGV